MGLMDKARQAAQQAAAMAQEGISQGQAKIEGLQVQKAGNELLRLLGEVFYAEQRAGGSREAVVRALAAVDEHIREHGPIVARGSGPAAGSGTVPGPGAAASPTPGPTSTPDGDDAWAGATDDPTAPAG